MAKLLQRTRSLFHTPTYSQSISAGVGRWQWGAALGVGGIATAWTLSAPILHFERYRVRFSAQFNAVTPADISLESSAFAVMQGNLTGADQAAILRPANPTAITALADGVAFFADLDVDVELLLVPGLFALGLPLSAVLITELNNTSGGPVDCNVTSVAISVERSLYDGPEYDV